MRYLAIDYGAKRTGLALCDKAETIASPLTVLATAGDLIDRILLIIRREEIDAIVLGLPLNMDSTEGPQARRVRDFAARLAKRTPLPIHLHDERLTSFDAGDKLAALDLTAAQKKKRLDALAAAAILQAFLDHKRDNPPSPPDTP